MGSHVVLGVEIIASWQLAEPVGINAVAQLFYKIVCEHPAATIG